MQVKFFATYIGIVGQRQIDVFAPNTVLDLLRYLSATYPGFRDKLLTEDNNDIRDDVIVMVNGRHIAHLGGVSCSIKESDVVAIMPQMAGG